MNRTDCNVFNRGKGSSSDIKKGFFLKTRWACAFLTKCASVRMDSNGMILLLAMLSNSQDGTSSQCKLDLGEYGGVVVSFRSSLTSPFMFVAN